MYCTYIIIMYIVKIIEYDQLISKNNILIKFQPLKYIKIITTKVRFIFYHPCGGC